MLNAILDPVSNRQDWIDTVEVYDDNENLVDLTGATIVMAVRDPKNHAQYMIAQTSDGTITIVSVGVFQFQFPLGLMRGFDLQRTFEVGCTILLNGITQQLYIGSVSVMDGIVP
jgi:hypothetical protein